MVDKIGVFEGGAPVSGISVRDAGQDRGEAGRRVRLLARGAAQDQEAGSSDLGEQNVVGACAKCPGPKMKLIGPSFTSASVADPEAIAR